MTFDYPAPAQICDLHRLWKEAFGDSDAFLDTFFDAAFSSRRCRCITEGSAVLAALYWFETTCGDQRFAYLYAVATALSHRGRGLFSALLQDTKKILTAEGFDGVLLVPETEDLGRMYEKFGFSACTSIRRISACAGPKAIALREIGAAEFARLRRSLLPRDAILQEGENLSILETQCHFWTGEEWLAVGQVYDGKLVCQEFLGDEAVIPGLLRALDVSSGEFRMPGKEEPFAYLLPLQPSCVRPQYFGLALD